MGGFGAAELKQLAQNRGADYQRFAGLSTAEILDYPLPAKVDSLAREILATADATLAKCPKQELKAKDPRALKELALGVRRMSRITDCMLRECNSLRLGCVALRQVAWKGGRNSFNMTRLQPLKKVIKPELYFLLNQLSDYGVPVLQVNEMPPGTGAPYSSAADSAAELLYAVMEDVSRGGALLLTKESSARLLDEAGAVYHRTGALPKVGDDGEPTGTRAISDLRLLNEATAAQAPARRKVVSAEPPPARYPRIVDAVRTIIRCFLRCPGLAVLLSLIDLSAAFKLLHLHIADAPSQATELPWGELEELLRSLPWEELDDVLQSMISVEESSSLDPKQWLPILVAVYFLLVFGARDNPGWMTVAASAITQACSRTGVPTILAELVGNLPAYFLALMDDALVVQSGEFAARLAVATYRYRAEQCFGERCINESKFQTNGQPAAKRKVWGYNLDTSPLADSDPTSVWLSVYDRISACTVTTPENKSAKMARLLMDDAYQHLDNRRITMKQHRSAAGLLNFLAGPSMVLRWLLTAFHIMSASTDSIWVSPPGSEAEVNYAWNLYATSRELILLIISDTKSNSMAAGTFTSSLVSALSIQERVALGAPLSHVGSDACWEINDESEQGVPTHGNGGMSYTCHLNHAVAVGSVRDFAAQLGKLLQLDRRTIIYVGELMPLVAGFMLFGESYSKRLLAWAVDNDPAGLSFARCGSRHPYAQFLHGVCIRVMSKYGFVCSAMYVNTKNNTFNDTMSRLYLTASREELLQAVETYYPGYSLLNLDPVLSFLCTEGTSSPFSFVLFGEPDPTLARAISAQRPHLRSGDRGSPSLRPTGTVVEIFAGMGQLSWAAQTVGFKVAGIMEPNDMLSKVASKRLKGDLKCLKNFDESSLVELGPVELLLVANPPRKGFTNHGTENLQLRICLPKLVHVLDPLVIIVEVVPGQLEDESSGLAGLDAAMKEAGYVRLLPPESTVQERGIEVEVNSRIPAHCGQQRVRHVLHFEKNAMADDLGELQELVLPSGPPKTLKDFITEPDRAPSDLWLKEKVRLEDNTGRKFRNPKAGEVVVVAHYTFKGGPNGELHPGCLVKIKGSSLEWVIEATRGKDLLLISPEKSQCATETPKTISREFVDYCLERNVSVKGRQGLASAIRTKGHYPEGPGNNLVFDEERGQARRLTTQEVWALQGLDEDLLDGFRALNPRASGRAQAQVAGLAVHTASAFAYVERAGKRIAIMQKKLRLQVVEGRIQRLWPRTEPWGHGGEHDEEGEGEDLEKDWEVPPPPEHVGQRYDASLVGFYAEANYPNTRASGGPRRERSAAIGLGTDMTFATRLASATLIANSLSLGTRSTYSSMLRHFTRFRYVRNEPPLPTGEDHALDQRTMITFVAYMGLVMSYAHSTVRVILYAVRRACLENELPDPLSHAPLLLLSLKGLKRLQGGPRRKVAASIDLIRVACADLDLEQWDQLVLALAMVLMYIFLLRSREALRKGLYADHEQCLRVRSIVLACQGEIVTGKSVQKADEVILIFGKSKADQEGQGSIHNAFESPGERLCVVSLLKKAHFMRPEHFENGDRFLLELQDGRVLHRDVVEKKLRKAAKEMGMPPEALGIISLRAGGASALWDMSTPVEAIKRRGRWASDSWKAYIWEGREKSRELAAQMMRSSFSMLASLARYAR
jgi:site-specific DNA-cytosine methylase